MEKLRGILPTVVTPFDREQCSSLSKFERLLGRLFEAGVHGVYVCGQTGEGLLQSVSQRKLVAEAAVRCAPGRTAVVVHVGAPVDQIAPHRQLNHAEAIRVIEGISTVVKHCGHADIEALISEDGLIVPSLRSA